MKITYSLSKQIKFGVEFLNGFIIDFLFFRIEVKRNYYSWENYTPKALVLSSSRDYYLRWCFNTNRSPKHYQYIGSENELLLRLDECDEIYLVGSYKLESLEVINKLSSKNSCVISKVL